jgi:hypothetical protein
MSRPRSREGGPKRSAGASVGAFGAGLVGLLSFLTGACGGYDALDVAARGFAPMEAELLEAPSRLGPTRAELRVMPPEGVDAFPWPWVVVGHPALQSGGGRVIAWARGPCDTSEVPGSAEVGPPWVICAAIRWDDTDTPPEAPLFTAVFESLATGRRVTFIGDTAAPEVTP